MNIAKCCVDHVEYPCIFHNTSTRGKGEEVMHLESTHITAEDETASDMELPYPDDDVEEDSNICASEECKCDDNKDEKDESNVFMKEGSNRLRNCPNREHLDLIVLDFLVKDGYLSAAETFLEEGITDFSHQLVADWKLKGKSYLLEERSYIIEAIWYGDISRAIKLTTRIDKKFFDNFPELLVRLRLQQFIELFRSSKLCKAQAMSFAKKHFSSFLRHAFDHNGCSVSCCRHYLQSDSCVCTSIRDENGAEIKCCVIKETQVIVETIMILMAFTKARLSHFDLAPVSTRTINITNFSQSLNFEYKESERMDIPNLIIRMLDRSRRAYLADQLNHKILRTLGMKNSTSSLLNTLNDTYYLQEEIVSGKVSGTGRPQRTE